jgi:hypothetical protein
MSSFVNFKEYRTRNISSTPTIIFVSQYKCRILCIHICNNTKNPLLLDIKVLEEIDNVGVNTNFCQKIPISGYGKQEMVNVSFNTTISQTPSLLQPAAGDILLANSDFVGNKFDSIVVYEELIEQVPQ